MKFEIQFDMNNQAFSDDACGAEVARILHRVAGVVESQSNLDLAYDFNYTLRDVNGNTVGYAKVQS